MTKISATVVADSIAPYGDRLTTLLVTLPRFILAELNTHRMLSKNSASSRAIPFNTMIKSVQDTPFMPIAWQKDHKGMQGSEYHLNQELQIKTWLEARDYAIKIASNLNNKDCNVTKQLCNRLLEPFMWHTVLISATEWENFFNLRCPKYSGDNGLETDLVFKSKKDVLNHFKDKNVNTSNLSLDDTLGWLQVNKGQSEIHMMALAEAMWDCYNESIPKQLEAGQWHIPFEDKILNQFEKELYVYGDKSSELINTNGLIKVSTSMAARTSYTIVGDEKEFTIEQQIALHDRLTTSGHYSPFEHCAKVMDSEEYERFVKGYVQDFYIDGVEGKSLDSKINGWCYNYRGFINYRYLLENGKH